MTTQNLDDRYAQTRLLLGLWAMGGLESAVKKSELTERVKRSKEKAGDYTPYLEVLVEQGAIALTDMAGNSVQKIAKGKILTVSLTESGKSALALGLADEGFQYEANVGCKVPNALLAWIRAGGSGVAGDVIIPKISSYEEFKVIALEVYDQLNRDYNYDKLVPIYKIRRAIGDRVTRSQFNEWLLEMQAKDILQLQEGSVEDSALDKIEDSITTKVNGLRCYAKLLES